MPGRIYSPTQTAEWSRCPFLWSIAYREGWRTRQLLPRDLAALLGQSFAAGMATFNTAKQQGLPEGTERTTEHAVSEAVGEYERVLAEWRAHGLDLSGLVRIGDGAQVLSDAVKKAIEQDATPIDWEVVEVEKPMEDYGRARADVVYRTPQGDFVVRDYKFVLSIPPKYIPERLEDYANHPQGYHYLWMHGATTFIPTLVVAQPFKIYERPVVRTAREIEQWLESQQAKWSIMEKMETGEVPIWKADNHKNQYGKCPLYEFCLDYEGDTTRLEALGFIQIKKAK